MESKVIERDGQFMVQVRDRTRGTWEDDKAFGTVAEALARENELRLEEQRELSGERVTATDRREDRETAQATVNRAAAETAQDQAEHRAVREAELAGREPPTFKHEQPKGKTRR